MNNITLFSGQPLQRGGLSNEDELEHACPAQFFEPHNPWTDYIAESSLWGRNMATWKWNSPDTEVQVQQMARLDNILDSHRLKMSARNAIAGWMLSEMLEEVPRA